nr:rRNA maturation RNase YbeY [Gammaproteobacteria bacterium]
MKRKGEPSLSSSLLLKVDLQVATEGERLPAPAELSTWIRAVLAEHREEAAEITIRMVGEAEGAALNQRYRGRRGATNVLAFPFDSPVQLEVPLLGDIVICAPIVQREAKEQRKEAQAHWAHMVVHGTLHLLGYDHQTPLQAHHMESLERTVLAALGFPNPYAETSTS